MYISQASDKRIFLQRHFPTVCDADFALCVVLQIPEENLFHCRVLYEDSAYAPLRGRQELEENVGIYLGDNYEKITVPVPHFGGSDPADIIHDFHRVRTKRTKLNHYTQFNLLILKAVTEDTEKENDYKKIQGEPRQCAELFEAVQRHSSCFADISMLTC